MVLRNVSCHYNCAYFDNYTVHVTFKNLLYTISAHNNCIVLCVDMHRHNVIHTYSIVIMHSRYDTTSIYVFPAATQEAKKLMKPSQTHKLEDTAH